MDKEEEIININSTSIKDNLNKDQNKNLSLIIKNNLNNKQNINKNNQSNLKDNLNWLVYDYFLRYDFNECFKILAKSNEKDNNKFHSEFSEFIKGLIKRYYGELESSTNCLKKCFKYNSNDIFLLKEIGKNLILTGKFNDSIDIYDEVLDSYPEDWECYHYKGIASMNTNLYEMAQNCFDKALSLNYNEFTLIQYGKLYLLNEDPITAISKYKEALKLNPDNPDLKTTIGSLYLKENIPEEAMKIFSDAVYLDKLHSNSLLGLGSLHQEKGEYELAYSKYKLASKTNPNSPIVWNNLGLCFFAKKKYTAAATCLKRAHYLDPFQWIISFNLGLVYLYSGLYSSAYIYMNAAVSLKPDIAIGYMYLGIILSKLGDITSSINSYDKSLELDNNYLTLFNYTISLISHDMISNAKSKFSEFVKSFNNDTVEREYKDDVLELSKIVKEELRKALIDS